MSFQTLKSPSINRITFMLQSHITCERFNCLWQANRVLEPVMLIKTRATLQLNGSAQYSQANARSQTQCECRKNPPTLLIPVNVSPQSFQVLTILYGYRATGQPRFLQALRERLTRLGDTSFAALQCNFEHIVMEEAFNVVHGTKLKACDTDTAQEQAMARNKIFSVSRLRCLTAWLPKLIDEPLRQEGA